MSNRLTFSLASLIFLIALGLVFVPTSVLAHFPLADGSKPGNLNHSHPTAEIAAEDYNLDGDTTDDGEALISGHSGHPALKSITVKQNAANTKVGKSGKKVVIGAAPNNTFTLVVEFTGMVSHAADQAPASTDVALTDSEIPFITLYGKNRIPIGGTNLTIGTPTQEGGNQFNKFEVVVTVDATSDAIPTGVAGDLNEMVIVGFRINADSVYHPPATLADGTTTVNGLGNVLSPAAGPTEFMLVKELDETSPTVTITHSPLDDVASSNGVVTFTFTFSEVLGSGSDAFTAADVTVTNGSKGTVSGPDAASKKIYTLPVTATDSTMDVKVKVGTAGVKDAAGNALSATGAEETYEAPKPPSLVVPTSATDMLVPVTGIETSNLVNKISSAGAVTFKLTFSEALASGSDGLDESDFTITSHVFDPATGKTMSTPVPNSDVTLTQTGSMYTLKVENLDPAKLQQEVLVKLDRTEVEDANGNELIAAASGDTLQQLRMKGIPAAWTGMMFEPWTFKADTIRPRVDIASEGTLLTGGGGTAPSGATALGGGGGLSGVPIHSERRGPVKDALIFTFTFSEPLAPAFTTEDIDSSGNSNVRLGTDSDPMPVAGSPEKYTVKVYPLDPTKKTTVLVRKGTVEDAGGNKLETDVSAAYIPQADVYPPVVAIAGPGMLMCGPKTTAHNLITITAVDNDKTLNLPGQTPSSVTIPASGIPTGEKIDKSDITVTPGWKIENFDNSSPPGATFNLVPILESDGYPAAAHIGITQVTVTIKKGAVKDAAGNESAKMDKTFTVGPVLDIPAGGYITVIRPEHALVTHLRDPLIVGSLGVRPDQAVPRHWDCMPDLTVFFQRGNVPKDSPNRPGIGGGALVVKVSPEHGSTNVINKGTVGISELMWASDAGLPHGGIPATGLSNQDQTREQWIELHNKNNFNVKVTLFARPANKALTIETNEIDRVSNYQLNNTWDVPGKSGDSAYGKDFIAMQRESTDYAGKAGTAAGQWKASTYIYLTRPSDLRNTGQLASENLAYDFIGTPARSNVIATSLPPTATPIPLKPFVFHEVANRSNAHYEWIELKNNSDKEANLRNYNIGIVTGKKDSNGKFVEDSLYNFPNSDVKIPAGGLLLVLASDPEDDGEHPVAVGRDVLGGNDQVRGIGLQNADSKIDPADYIVANKNEMFYTAGLPDNGEFVLILRRNNKVNPGDSGTYNQAGDANSAKGKLGTADFIVDVAGHHPNLKVSGDSLYDGPYGLWPLKLRGPSFSKNQLNRDQVYQRRDTGRPGVYGENNNDKPAFVKAGYTGVGYKRHAQNTDAHGGTPGYNDIRKNLVGDIAATGTVTISEIMFDRGRNNGLPQWIELYNSSATQAVNLHSEAGWRLMIENYDDGEMPIARISGTLNFKSSEVQTILPQQTVLVASARARSAGSATLNSSVVFIPTRVFTVYDDARGELGMTRSTDPILSTEAFHITLVDGKGNVSDEVGNLIKSRRRVAAEAAWKWDVVRNSQPNRHPFPDDARVSVLRRYNEYMNDRLVGRYSDADIMDMGTTAAGWLSAHMPHKRGFLHVPDTWYGDGDDIGTPAITGGRPLPVSLSKFRPERLENGDIVIRWITESELNNAGFNILRSDTRNGQFTQINTSLIAGQGTTSERTNYEWKDTTAKPNVVYYYQIQDVSLDGEINTLRQSRLKGHLTPSGKLTTTWGDLKALQ